MSKNTSILFDCKITVYGQLTITERIILNRTGAIMRGTYSVTTLATAIKVDILLLVAIVPFVLLLLLCYCWVNHDTTKEYLVSALTLLCRCWVNHDTTKE